MPNLTQFAAGAGIGAGGRECRFVSFCFADRHYAIDVDDVYGIYHGNPIIPTPDLSEFVDGEMRISELRIPVINLRRYLGLDHTATDRQHWVIAVNDPGGPVGLAVDKVNEVIRLEANELLLTKSEPDVPMGNYICQRAHYQGRWLFIPDLHSLLRHAMI